jgi:hypothetical protein
MKQIDPYYVPLDARPTCHLFLTAYADGLIHILRSLIIALLYIFIWIVDELKSMLSFEEKIEELGVVLHTGILSSS